MQNSPFSKPIRKSFPVNYLGNRISFTGNLSENDILGFEKCFHEVCTKKQYSDVILDFRECESVFQNFMVPAIARCRELRKKFNVDFIIEKSRNTKVSALFHNANWAHLISPDREEPTTFGGVAHVPAIAFRDQDEQFNAVDQILDCVLSTLEGLNRGHLKAVEWCINEITDNVLSHAESSAGGIVQVTTFGTKRKVQLIVADGGRGIPSSLGVLDPKKALIDAITEGVTRSDEHQGNGLYGSMRIATTSHGFFELRSYCGVLKARFDEVNTDKTAIPYNGTYAIAEINFENDQLLEQALKFKGRSHDPGFDYLEKKYEVVDDENFHIKMAEFEKQFGSREGGSFARKKLRNLIEASGSKKVIVDFENVLVFSSSFADEVFGKLFVDLGPILFTAKIEFENVNSTARSLIDRAIYKRVLQDYL